MDPEARRRFKERLLSGAVSGIVLGGAGSAVGGAKTLGQIAKAALQGGAIAGGVSAGAGHLGDKILGNPDPNDPQANTKHAALGGALALGLVGAGAGAGLANPTLKKWLSSKLEEGVLKKGLTSIKNPGVGAAVLGGGGALAGGYYGADEGMQADFASNLREAEKRKKRQQLLQEIGMEQT